jgi:SAM-dependent methyltransferase
MMTTLNPGDLIAVTCQVCGADGDEALLHVKDGFRIVRCRHCGFVYLNPRVREEVMERLYQDEYFESGGLEVGYRDYAQHGDYYRRTFRMRLRRAKRYTDGGRLLDVGCGPGFGLDAARDLGFEAWGIDVSRYATSIARQTHGDRVVRGVLTRGSFPPAHFDVATMFDVFEHIYEPRPFLDTVAEILKPDGLLVITTPNHDSLLSRLSGPRWVSFKVPEHVAYYTPRTIAAVLGERFRILETTSAGQHCSLEFLIERVQQFNRPVGAALMGIVRTAHLQRLPVYANNGSMTLVTQKGTAAVTAARQ